MSWYEVIEGPKLMQCDLLPGTSIPIVTSTPQEVETDDDIEVTIESADVVVLSQSCDLVQDKVDSIVVAPYESWAVLVARENPSASSRRDKQKRIIKRQIHNLQILPENVPAVSHPWSIIDFSTLYSLPRLYLEQHADAIGPRLRVVSPYREEISQEFARYFMRVALEDEGSAFNLWEPPPAVAPEGIDS